MMYKRVKHHLFASFSPARLASMPTRKSHESADSGTWNFREVPREALRKAKIAAALKDISVKELFLELVEAHWQELEKKGVLPKGKS